MGISSTNAANPTQPEYGKAWKADNNAGCLCNLIISNPVSCVTTVQKFTRNDQSDDLISEKDCQKCSNISNNCSPVGTTNSSCSDI